MTYLTYLNTRHKELIDTFAKIANKLCDSYEDCNACPFHGYASCPCEQAHAVQAVQNDISDMEEEPSYEDLPIDLDDDNHCDECCKPTMNGCYGRGNLADDCPYDLGECCEDNLATNVGRICFEHNVSTNVAMALIEIIKKERDRNEYLRIYRKHIEAE